MSTKHELPLLPEADCMAMFTHMDGTAKCVDGYSERHLRDYGEAVRAQFTEHIQRLEAEAQQANEYARQLAVAIHAKYYPEVTQWSPLPDLMGVLTQIDNMTAGLVKPGRLEADNQALKKGEGALDLDAAAKKLAECIDYPWDCLHEQDRATMRQHARAIIDAAMTKEQKP